MSHGVKELEQARKAKGGAAHAPALRTGHPQREPDRSVLRDPADAVLHLAEPVSQSLALGGKTPAERLCELRITTPQGVREIT